MGLAFNSQRLSRNHLAADILRSAQSVGARWGDGTLIISAHQASIAVTSKWKREWRAVGHVWADFSQTTSHANAIRVFIGFRVGLKDFVAMFGYLLGNNLRILTRTLHECVNHRIKELLRSLFLRRLFHGLLLWFIFKAHEVNGDDLGLFTRHHNGMGHHII